MLIATQRLAERPAIAVDVPDLATAYIKTSTWSYISKSAILENTENVSLGSKSIIKGDARLASGSAHIRIGRSCTIGSGAVFAPPSLEDPPSSPPPSASSPPLPPPPSASYLPMTIGPNTSIGARCDVRAASIGANCVLEAGVLVGRRAIIKDNVHVLANSVLPPDSFYPPFSVVAGNPAKIVQMNNESWPEVRKIEVRRLYALWVNGAEEQDLAIDDYDV